MKPKTPKRVWIPRWHGSETGLAEDVWYDTPIQNSVEYIRADAKKRKPLPRRLRALREKLSQSGLHPDDEFFVRIDVLRELLRRAGDG